MAPGRRRRRRAARPPSPRPRPVTRAPCRPRWARSSPAPWAPTRPRSRSTPTSNVDQSTQEKLQYAKKGTPLHDVKETESLKGTGGATGGTAGAAANLPTYAQTRGRRRGNSNYKRTTGTTDFGVDKTVTRTKIAPGAINKLDVALLVDKSVPAAQATELKKAVAAAAGINPKRGDTMTQSTVVFAKPKAAPGPAGLPVPPALLGPAEVRRASGWRASSSSSS